MQFTYRITADEFAASQVLYEKLRSGRKRFERAAFWVLFGSFFIVVAWNERAPAWAPILVAATGVSSIYGGLRILFPSRYFRRAYRRFEFAGKPFEADVNENGFEIKSDFCDWSVRWPGVQLKGEDGEVFIFVSGGTIFIFGKKYLNNEQQQELRGLSGLATGDGSPPTTTH
jgi:hypothetical protein